MATANLGRVGFVNKGTYSGATAYKVNDVATYNTGTYACIQANTGQAPTNTSYWQNWVSDNAVHKTGDETIAGVKTFSNNVGIGVAPSAWGVMGNVTTYSVGSSGIQFLVGANAYYNSGYKYASTGIASQYEQYNGIHYWKTAPSGTVGGALTWNTAMTLGNNGNLLVGTTTDNGVDKLQVNGSCKLGESAPSIKMKKVTGTTAGTVGGTTTAAHGVNASKIISVNALVQYGSNAGDLTMPGDLSTGYQFYCFTDSNYLNLRLHPTTSQNILNRPFTVLITYEA